MTSLAKATGAPVSRIINDVEVTVYPLRFREWGKLEAWMRQTILRDMIEALKANSDLSESQQRIIIGETNRSTQKISIMNEDVRSGLLQSVEAMLHVIYLSLARGNESLSNQSGVLTIEKVDDLIGGSSEILTDLVETVFDLSFPDNDEKGGTDSDHPTEKTPKPSSGESSETSPTKKDGQ